MAEASIPVDLFNPGQVFACLGFLEAADILLGDAEGGFDWSDEANVKFILRAAGARNPFEAVLEFICCAQVQWLSHDEEVHERDGGTTITRSGISDSLTPKPADLPAVLVGEYAGSRREIPFGYWADGSGRFATTFKKSTNGASSHIRFANSLSAIKELDGDRSTAAPYDQGAKTESLFRLDPRGSVDPIHGGTSPDKLRKGGVHVRVATYPICETLAIIGLQHARPIRQNHGEFRYSVWGRQEMHSDENRLENHRMLLPPELARAAISGSISFLDKRTFSVEHEEVKQGGDRKMTRFFEEIEG